MQRILFFLLLTIITSTTHGVDFAAFQATLSQHKEIINLPTKVIDYQLFKETIIGAYKKLKENQRQLIMIPQKKTLLNCNDFTPFVNKVELHTASILYFWGDLHGSAHAFMRSLIQLIENGALDTNCTIKDANTYFIFLGDFVDRGMYGVEVLYLICNLYLQNPQQVLLVRGNHEDITINMHNSQASFTHELNCKYQRDSSYNIASCTSMLSNLYNALPVATFIGYDLIENQRLFLQACHGGLEIGYSAYELLNSSYDYQLLTALNRRDAIMHLDKDMRHALYQNIPTHARLNYAENEVYGASLGFMWSDFCTDNTTIASYTPYRGWCYGKKLTKELLAMQSSSSARITTIIRGHQHHGAMLKKLIEYNGHYTLYDNMVHTLFSAPAILHIENNISNYVQVRVSGIKK